MRNRTSICCTSVAIAVLLLVAPLTSFAINKCVGPDGRISYSDKACPEDQTNKTPERLGRTSSSAMNHEFCSAVRSLSNRIARLMRRGMDSRNILSTVGGGDVLNQEEFVSIVSYVYGYKDIDQQVASNSRIAGLAYNRCMGGNWIGRDRFASGKAASATKSGSGFLVSSSGIVITNQHVVSNCTEFTVNHQGKTEPATLVETRPQIDLAALRISSKEAYVTFRDPIEPVLGESIVVAGFPLSGVLSSDLNIVTGSVSALMGVGNNEAVFQITAPIQPGNSGGPVMDMQGHVVGIVVSSLNPLWAAKSVGTLPQNVNFAIRAAAAKQFLREIGVEPPLNTDRKATRVEEVASHARTFTVGIKCE